jgi:coenzyme A diphosphatase NUDT7
MELNEILSKLTNHIPDIVGSSNAAKFAVLLPLLQKDDSLHILFEVRSRNLRRQPGEICFPGGKIDPQDENPKAAAIRETTEELGINTEDITNVFPLNYMLSPFGMFVYPFAGLINHPEKIKPNLSEVDEIFTVPLNHFLKTPPEVYKISFKLQPEEKFPFHLIPGGEKYQWRAREMDEYFYYYNEKTIWGLTAKILTDFVELIR